MDEEDEDLLDIFADESDPLLSTDLVEEYLRPDKCNVNTSEQKSDTTPETTKTADEATALAELPNYTPIEKDRDVKMEDKVEDVGSSLLIPHAVERERISEPLSGEKKIDSSLNEIISDSRRRENRKRQFNPALGASDAYGMRGYKQKYMTKNGVQLCLHPRKDIAKLSEQEAGDELARCLDEVSDLVFICTITIVTGLGPKLQLTLIQYGVQSQKC